MDKRGEKATPQASENHEVEKQHPADNGVEQRVVSFVPAPPLIHALPNTGEVEKPEEDPVEAERLANWKANFPYKPTTDPDVVITEEIWKAKILP